MIDRLLIVQPWPSEKAGTLQGMRKYVFIVAPSATKNEIKKAVKARYKVDATGVTIINQADKVRGFGRVRGVVQGRKKAIVTIKEGQTIALE